MESLEPGRRQVPDSLEIFLLEPQGLFFDVALFILPPEARK
jgi:hypothetical protein